MCFCCSCVAGVAQLACLLAFPSFPPTLLGKYQFHTLVFPVQCCVDRYLEVGCGSVAMVTSLLLRRLLPSSVATFKTPTLPGLSIRFKVDVPTGKVGGNVLFARQRREFLRGIWGHSPPPPPEKKKEN